MNRGLRFLPAVLLGLLAGWGVSRFVRPRPVAVQATHRDKATFSSEGSTWAASAWRAMLDARAPQPVIADKADFHLKVDQLQESPRSQSPARRELEFELLRAGIPEADTLSALRVIFRESAAQAGLDEHFSRAARRDPAGTWKWLEEMAQALDPRVRDSSDLGLFRASVLHEWLRQDPQAALAYVTTTGTSWSRANVLSTFVEEWAKLDPAAAAAALPGLPDIGPAYERKDFAESLLRTWHEKDPAAARAWAETGADPEWRDALKTVADELDAASPAAKASVLLAAPQRDSQRLADLLGSWLSADSAQALEKITAIPPDDPFWQHDAANAAQRWAMLARGGTAPEDLPAALRAVPAGPQRDALLAGLADYGASNDIPFATRIVAGMGEGRARQQAMSTLTELWMRQDPVALSEWLTTLPPSDSRHEAVRRFAELLAKSDPERATQWAQTLPEDSPQKESVLQAIRTAQAGP